MDVERIKENLGCLVPIIVIAGLIFYFQYSSDSGNPKERVGKENVENNDGTGKEVDFNYFEDEYMIHTVLLGYKHNLDTLAARNISYQYYKTFDWVYALEFEPSKLQEAVDFKENAESITNFITKVSDSSGISKKQLSSYIFDLRVALESSKE